MDGARELEVSLIVDQEAGTETEVTTYFVAWHGVKRSAQADSTRSFVGSELTWTIPSWLTSDP
jgi:hypothetical protein